MEIGLVLGGGGARGLAHIGVLQELVERGHRPVALAGCSMGAVLGALFAAGKSPDDLRELAAGLRRRDMMELGDHGALLGNNRIGEFLRERLPDTFGELSIPLRVTVTAIDSAAPRVLGEGDLVSALLASSAIPGVLPPVERDGRMYLDGGILNNLPVDVIRAMTNQPVMAVDVGVPASRRLDFSDEWGLFDRLKEIFHPRSRWLTVELFLKASDIPTETLTRARLAMHPPDVLVRPALDEDMGREDFPRWEEAVEAGRRAAADAMDEVGW